MLEKKSKPESRWAEENGWMDGETDVYESKTQWQSNFLVYLKLKITVSQCVQF